jgi:hypothetical protein
LTKRPIVNYIIRELFGGGYMAGKLTLSLDEQLISFAHEYSRKTGVSISELVAQYFARLQPESSAEKLQLHPKTAMLLGVFKDNPIPDKKQLRMDFNDKSAC